MTATVSPSETFRLTRRRRSGASRRARVSVPDVVPHSFTLPPLQGYVKGVLVDGRTVEVQRKPPASYGYDHVCDEHQTQSEIFESVGVPVTDAFLEGYHGCLIAYGQTGAGKTFTMQGIQNLAVQDLFERGIDYWQNDQRNFAVTVSMYEIYGDKIYDLLNNHEQLKIMEDKNNKIQIFGLSEQFVSSEEQILDLIDQGNLVRTTHATSSNETSSRSHAVC